MFFGRYMAWGWGWPMLVSSVLFWALVVVLIVLLIRYLTRGGGQWAGPRWHPPGQPGPHPGAAGYPQHGPFPPGPGPEQLLAERFARGEIDEQEFRHRMEVLRNEARAHAQPPGAPPPGSPPPGPPPPGAPPAQGPPPGTA